MGWAIRALAERWPEDEAVQSTLASLVNPDDGPISDSAIWRLSSIIADAEAALDRLAAIAPDHDGQAAVVDALRDLIERGVNRHDDRVTTILDAAIAHDMASPWTSPEAALYVGFADDDRVRAMAMGRLGDRGAPLGAIAYGFAHDADVRKALARGLRPLSPPLRGRLVEALAEASTTDEDVTTLLSRYDAESDAVVKILSAAAFARRLQAAEAVTDAVVAQFTEQARALGHDHDERRAAAFCAIAELGRLDVLVDLRDRVTPDQSRSRTLPSATEASSSDSYVASGRTSKQRSARSSRTDSATVTAVTPSSGPTS